MGFCQLGRVELYRAIQILQCPPSVTKVEVGYAIVMVGQSVSEIEPHCLAEVFCSSLEFAEHIICAASGREDDFVLRVELDGQLVLENSILKAALLLERDTGLVVVFG